MDLTSRGSMSFNFISQSSLETSSDTVLILAAVHILATTR